MTSAPASRRRLLGVAATSVVAVAVTRDLRRARRVARLAPPVPRVDVLVDPRPVAGATDRAPVSDVGDDSERSRDDRPPHRAVPIRLAALGDSSIAGVGASRLSACLAVQIAERVAAGCNRPVHVEGHGVSGARTADIARQVLELDATTPPDVVVVVVGANDVAHVTSPWRFVAAVRGVHRGLHERVDVPVVVCSLPEFRAITAVGRPLRAVAVAYGRLLGALQRRGLRVAPGVRWVDARRVAGPTFRRRPDAMAADGYHPSDIGYALLADALAPAVVAALRRPDVDGVRTGSVVEHTFYTGVPPPT